MWESRTRVRHLVHRLRLWRQLTMEKAKVVEYKKFAEERGAKFYPFILETLGTYGKETAIVLKVLAKAVFNSNIDAPRDYLVQCNRVLAVAVQRGKGLVGRPGGGFPPRPPPGGPRGGCGGAPGRGGVPRGG